MAQAPAVGVFMPPYRDVAFGPMNMGVQGEELQQRVLQAMAAVDIDPQWYGNAIQVIYMEVKRNGLRSPVS
ncbi:MAG: hypothetical protein RMY16_16180 [Nostoc sp. DedQUE12b]|uniref:hypothetical protein n=1 Tax=Nostoc sp. DedQUE12b TaxID=3075398 RepID=UPI002AD42162|nr:hypothetical protein [Nostoc sp. DedQUE12b]MDZ8087075.1 hypothetical protein [Nostoc sp. DedQUE12b]